MNPVTRTYSARIVGVDPELLWSHHETTCRAKGVVSDMFTAFRAGVGPELVDPRLGALSLQRQLVAALWFPAERAAPESGLVLEPVDPVDSIEQFRQELAECGLTADEQKSWLEDVRPALTMAIREDAVRVNRRGQLRRWCAAWGVAPREALHDTAELTLGRSWPDIVAALAKTEEAVSGAGFEQSLNAADAVPELSSPSLNNVVATWVSNRFGKGGTSDRAGKARAARAVSSIAVPEAEVDAAGLLTQVARALGADATRDAVLHQVHTGGENGRAGGARSRLYRRLEALLARAEPVEPGEINELVQVAAKEAEKQGSSATRSKPPWSEALQDRVTRDTGLTFENRNRAWKEILNGGVGRVVTNTSWTVRQLATRRALAAARDGLTDALGHELVELLDEWCRERGEETGADRPARLTGRTIGSAKDVMAEFATLADPQSRRDAVGEVQSRRDRDFGDPAFFEWLAGDGAAVWRDVTPDQAEKRLQRYAKLVKSRERWDGLRLPQLSHPDPVHAPHWSLFDCGSSNYQAYKLEKASRDQVAVDATGFSIKITLWDGAAWRESPARVTSTYFAEQVQAQHDALARHGVRTSSHEGTPVARVDAIGRRVSVRTQDVLRVAESNRAATPTLQLKFDRTRHRRDGHEGVPAKWSVALATRLTPTRPGGDGTPGRSPAKGRAPLGHRTLGVDLGLRTLAGWAVWEVVDTGEISTVAASSQQELPTRHLTCRTPDEAGPFNDHQLVYRELDGHQEGHWARLDAAGLLGIADGRKSSGRGVESQSQRSSPQPQKQDWWLAARALKYAGARLSAPTHVTDAYRTSDLAFDYLSSAKRAVVRHAQLAGVAVALDGACEPERLLRLLSGWWKAAAREPRSTLATLWRSHVLPELPREPRGALVEWRGQRGQKPHLPRPGLDDLRAYVDRLLSDPQLRRTMAARLHAEWDVEDERLRVPLRLARVLVSGGAVPEKLAREIGMPRSGKHAAAYQHAGAVLGLGPRRLKLLDELYRLKRSWHMRRRPHRPDGETMEVEQQADGSYTALWGTDVMARLTEKRDRVRDQLSKQIASALVETALANGCHSIAYEDLEHYRTSLHRNRDENAKLRLWAHQSISKHLHEIATLHGLGCRPVNPRGTSQYCAVTEQRGVRVERLPAHRFNEQRPTWWSSALEVARTRDRRGETRPIDEAVLNTEPFFDDVPAHGSVLVPSPGGEYFAATWPPERGIWLPEQDPVPLPNADLNAAANIGLRPLVNTPQRKNRGSGREAAE